MTVGTITRGLARLEPSYLEKLREPRASMAARKGAVLVFVARYGAWLERDGEIVPCGPSRLGALHGWAYLDDTGHRVGVFASIADCALHRAAEQGVAP